MKVFSRTFTKFKTDEDGLNWQLPLVKLSSVDITAHFIHGGSTSRPSQPKNKQEFENNVKKLSKMTDFLFVKSIKLSRKLVICIVVVVDQQRRETFRRSYFRHTSVGCTTCAVFISLSLCFNASKCNVRARSNIVALRPHSLRFGWLIVWTSPHLETHRLNMNTSNLTLRYDINVATGCPFEG